jgi:hypothetical protein
MTEEGEQQYKKEKSILKEKIEIKSKTKKAKIKIDGLHIIYKNKLLKLITDHQNYAWKITPESDFLINKDQKTETEIYVLERDN